MNITTIITQFFSSKQNTRERINIHSVYSVICGHDKSDPYSGCTWVNVGMRE